MIIFDELLQGRPSPKPGKANQAEKRKGSPHGAGSAGRNRVMRVANKSPEVMVKVSGYSKGVKHLRSHLEYITRNGDVPGETDRGDQILSRSDVHYLHQEWADDLGRRTEGKTRDSAHIVLSMPPGHDPDTVYESAKAFAREEFDNHQFLAVLHTDEKHPHVHLAVKTLGYDGKRLHIKKGDPQRWREHWAEKLRDRGIEAEATPRAVRGVVRKSARQPHLHMRKEGRAPEVYKARARDALEGNPKDRPWELKIQERQQFIRGTWERAETELKKEGRSAEAEAVAKFRERMPPLKTERQMMREAAYSRTERQAERGGAERDGSGGPERE